MAKRNSPLNRLSIVHGGKILTIIIMIIIIIIIIIIIYHDILPTPRRGSHVKSDKTHTQSSRYTP